MPPPKPKTTREKVLIIDAQEPLDACVALPWTDIDRYMDRRRLYLVRMADTVVIRNVHLGLDYFCKIAGRSAEVIGPRVLNKQMVDTMAACGFGLGAA